MKNSKEKKIIRCFNSGMKKKEIKKKYKISDTQLASIIKNDSKKRFEEAIQAHPKHFKLNDK